MHDTLTNLTSLYRPSVAEKLLGSLGINLSIKKKQNKTKQKKNKKKKQKTFANIFILSLSPKIIHNGTIIQ